jgi:ribonuclease HII
MAVLVGIDEAGFGPILGPLVVSSSAFSMSSETLKADLWKFLRNSVTQTKNRLAGRILIADSKKAYTRSLGIKHLQRTVLTCLACLDRKPATVNDLLAELCPNCRTRILEYPWHQNLDTCTLAANNAAVSIAAETLKNDLQANKITLLGLESRCLDVAYYNKMVADVKNKANVLFTATATLIKNAYDRYDDEEIQVIADRQGGRSHYRQNLLLMFGDMKLKILRETPTISSYELSDGRRRMRVHFVVAADDKYLPVSLASMVSKYVRELLIDGMNRYFRGFCADLKPTAGYWKDGLRFIDDLKRHLPHIQYDSNQLIRCR